MRSQPTRVRTLIRLPPLFLLPPLPSICRWVVVAGLPEQNLLLGGIPGCITMTYAENMGFLTPDPAAAMSWGPVLRNHNGWTVRDSFRPAPGSKAQQQQQQQEQSPLGSPRGEPAAAGGAEGAQSQKDKGKDKGGKGKKVQTDPQVPTSQVMEMRVSAPTARRVRLAAWLSVADGTIAHNTHRCWPPTSRVLTSW